MSDRRHASWAGGMMLLALGVVAVAGTVWVCIQAGAYALVRLFLG